MSAKAVRRLLAAAALFIDGAGSTLQSVVFYVCPEDGSRPG
jgi:hypothetical protein